MGKEGRKYIKEMGDVKRWQDLWFWKDVEIVFLEEMSWKDRKWWLQSGMF